MTAPKKTPDSATLNRPLHIPFGKGYDVAPLKAINALRVRAMAAAIDVDDPSDEQVAEAMDRLKELGVEDPDSYGEFEMGNDLFGLETNVAMLNDLTMAEYDVARSAVIGWTLTQDRKPAEELLANPTGRPRPQDHKAPAKKPATRKPAAKKTSSSR